jgi:hypothetical protein
LPPSQHHFLSATKPRYKACDTSQAAARHDLARGCKPTAQTVQEKADAAHRPFFSDRTPCACDRGQPGPWRRTRRRSGRGWSRPDPHRPQPRRAHRDSGQNHRLGPQGHLACPRSDRDGRDRLGAWGLCDRHIGEQCWRGTGGALHRRNPSPLGQDHRHQPERLLLHHPDCRQGDAGARQRFGDQHGLADFVCRRTHRHALLPNPASSA